MIQALKARGCQQILVSETSTSRQEFARKFGASDILNPLTQDVIKASQAICNNGEGPDVVFDCAGVQASIDTACKVVRARGQIINVAIWAKPIQFQPNDLVMQERRFFAVLGYTAKDYTAVIEALGRGDLQPAEMITRKIRLEDLVEEGFKALIEENDKHVKIMVDMAL